MPPAAGDFVMTARAVGLHLADREADAQRIRVLPPRPRVVAAGDLARALEQVADGDAGGQAVPVVPGPAVLVDERRDEQRRVGHPAGHHDVGALRERVDDRPGAEVDVGEQRVGRQRQLVGQRADVVAHHGGHGEAGDARRLQRVDDGPPGGHRVDAAGVGDELGPAVDEVRQGRPHVQREVARVAEGLVALAVLLQDGEGQLGQGLADEVVDAGVEHVGDGLRRRRRRSPAHLRGGSSAQRGRWRDRRASARPRAASISA